MKEIIIAIKKLVKEKTSIEELKKSLECNFERITGRADKPEYDEKYDLLTIARAKKIKSINKKYSDDMHSSCVIEIYEYPSAPNQVVIAFNVFDEDTQTQIELFV